MEDAGYGGSGAAKRRRDEPEDAPEAKRIRAADLILDMLDDAEPADSDLASVMRSLQEEIAPFSSPQADRQLPDDGGVSTSVGDPRESDLGYLLEASDDELGLPPTVPSSDEGDAAEAETREVGTQGPEEGFGQIWALEEIRSCYDALEFAEFGQVVGGGDDGLVFDGGLFDYADAASLAEFSWHPESLPAV